jgi:hypothetical protein
LRERARKFTEQQQDRQARDYGSLGRQAEEDARRMEEA